MRAEDWLKRAVELRSAGRLEEARVELEGLVRAEPEFGEGCHQLGNLLKAMGRLAEAVEPLETAARLEPGNALVFLNLGVTYLELEQPEAAVAALEGAFPA